MLDTEPTGAGGDDTRDASSKDSPEIAPARTRRRKAVAAPETEGAAEAAPARRRARKAAPATGAEPAVPAGEPAAVPAGEPVAAPAKRTRSRRTAPTSDAATGDATGTPEVPADVAAGAGTPDSPPPARRKRSRAAAAVPAEPAAGAAGPEGLTAGAAAWTAPATADLPAGPRAEAQPPPTEAAAPRARRGRRRATSAETSPAAGAATPAGPVTSAGPATSTEPTTSATPTTSAGPAASTRSAGPGRSAGSGRSARSATSRPDAEPPATETGPTAASPFASEQPERPTGRTRRRATSPETSPPPAPAVMFVAPVAGPSKTPVPASPDPGSDRGSGAEAPPRRRRGKATPASAEAPEAPETPETRQAGAPGDQPDAEEQQPTRRRRSRARAAEPAAAAQPAVEPADEAPAEADQAEDGDDTDESADRRRRRRGRRGRGRSRATGEAGEDETEETSEEADEAEEADESAEEDADRPPSRRRRRRRRRGAGGDGEDSHDDDPPDTVVHVRETRRGERDRGGDRDRSERGAGDDEVRGVRGSTRLEAKRQRRRDGRDTGRRRPPILTESEFLARREAVDRVMVVRQRGDRTQIAVLEDDILVEHYVTKASSNSYAGNVYLGRVQNVLPSMEAAFVDIGKGRNAVLYAGEVNWDVAGLEGRARSIEHALKSGDNIVVQVTKDPIGHKGARLTSQVSLAGRYLVYVPNGSMTGISRKLPDTERSRLKDILRRIVPEEAGVIIRTAAEGASEEELTRDVQRLQAQWESIQRKATQTKSAPTLLYAEPDLELRVVRDVFNEDFTKLIVSGDDAWEMISQYVGHVAPDLLPRLSKWSAGGDAFADLRIDEQLLKGLDRKVYLPSGGSLVIDRTEAMTVIDVNTGKFVGQGGNLEQTVTRNNLEAAEEIVRQLRLRDIGGIIVIDFIDMVLESNRDLVLRRLTECLGRDRTKHQVAEVTSLGLVQMTRKRVGQGLLEAFSEPCPTCGGRGLLVHTEPVDDSRKRAGSGEAAPAGESSGRGRRGRRGAAAEAGPPTPALLAGSTPAAATEAAAAVAPAGAVEAAEVEAAPESGPEAAAAAGTAPEPGREAAAAAGTAPEPGPAPGSDIPVDAGAAAEIAPPDGGAGSAAEVRAPTTDAATAYEAADIGAVVDAGGIVEAGAAAGEATVAEIDVASEDHRPADEALDTVEAVEPEADVTFTGEGRRTAVAGSNEVFTVEPGAGLPAAEPTPDLPVAGSNGVPDAAGNGRAPRRRRRAASRPAGPPQPVSSD